MKSKISITLSLIFTAFIFPQDDFKVLSSNAKGVTIEYSPEFSIDSEQINNTAFLKISFPFGTVDNPQDAGTPSVQVRYLPIGVPGEFGNTVEIISSEFKELEGRLIPKPILSKKDGISSVKYEIGNEYYSYTPSEQLIEFNEFATVRGMPVQYFKIRPIMYSPVQNKIKLYTKILFRVNYSSAQTVSNFVNDTFLEDIIPNYKTAKKWIQNKRGDKFSKIQIDNSVLAAGKWIRFETTEEGIYKIDRSTLASFGIDPNLVDPRTIKIYNNGGKVLPEAVNSPKFNDLVENAVYLYNSGDESVFDNEDYILFYGRGINFWDFDSNSKTVKRYFHTYSTANYYWLTYGGGAGKRMEGKTSLNESVRFVQPSTLAYANWEEDKINLGKTGRIYLGDDFSQTVSSRSYLNKLDGRLPNSAINYTFRFVNASSGSITFTAEESGTQLFSQSFFGYGSTLYSYGTAHIKTASYSGALTDSRSNLKIKFTPTSATSIGYLDYFELKYDKELKAIDDFILFFSKDTSSVIEYDLSGFSSSSITVFDVSDFSNVKIISNPIMLSGSEFRFQALETAGKISKYIAVESKKFKSPVNAVEISNQNLHGFSEGAKLIIIYHKSLKDQALRLKAYRENNSKLNISAVAVDVNEIYNEFSGGLLDVTAIRDYIKYAYDNWTIQPEYVLLFGDGTYDYKNLEKNTDNLVPPYETVESLNEIYSYSSDDYFARVDGNDTKLDLAVGRINVVSLSEAKIVVDKIIDYETNQERGIWRNLITLVADDNLTTSGIDYAPNTPQSEDLSKLIPGSFDQNKIYIAAYPTVLTALGRTKPGVFDEIINSVNRGTLILNFIGHGSPELWAHERVFVKSSSIPLMKNDKYFFLTAATCDFGYYDIPGFQSSTEALITKESSGAIGVFSASRPVYSTQNANLNEALFSNLLSSTRDTLNLPSTVGKAYLKGKLIGSGDISNDEKFHLFSDPVLRLNIPQFLAQFDSINGQDLSSDVQIRALSNTKIEGVVKKSESLVWDDFNGEGTLTVFDSKRQIKLDPLSTPTNPFYMTVQGGLIFRGRVSITNGKFSTSFVVPKDISYENTNGKILMYYSSDNGDGLGYTTKIKIGGTDSNAVNDEKGPEIEIFFDESSQPNTALVNQNSVLIVKLKDESGINTTGTGVGHKLEGILNGNTNEPIDFTNFFTGDLDAGGKSGLIRYRFTNLDAGNYEMLVKAWDVFNNLSTEKAYFTVVAGDDLFISDVYNYPNPFTTTTTFTFQKNSVGSLVDANIKIYTVSGRLIRTIDSKNLGDNFVRIEWDGRDQDGNQIANGTYLYKLNVTSVDGVYNKNILGKLAVVR